MLNNCKQCKNILLPAFKEEEEFRRRSANTEGTHFVLYNRKLVNNIPLPENGGQPPTTTESGRRSGEGSREGTQFGSNNSKLGKDILLLGFQEEEQRTCATAYTTPSTTC